MDRKEWALLAIAAAQGDFLTPVQLQKSVFLMDRNLQEMLGPSGYDFTPYHYGPFDARVYDDAELLQLEGAVEIKKAEGDRWSEYSATAAGLIRAEELKARIPPDAAAYIGEVVKWARSLTFQQLIRAIYRKYPEMRANSVFSG
ncbi:MAG: hypothetical protein AB1814_01970 [Thermodesulfobacteriota bacterium]